MEANIRLGGWAFLAALAGIPSFLRWREDLAYLAESSVTLAQERASPALSPRLL